MDSLPGRDQRKLVTMIKMLEKTGIQLRAPHAKAIEGEKNLFELRSQLGNNIQRIFYCHFTGTKFILLHGFTKKTQKTPQREIVVALTRRAEFFQRNLNT